MPAKGRRSPPTDSATSWKSRILKVRKMHGVRQYRRQVARGVVARSCRWSRILAAADPDLPSNSPGAIWSSGAPSTTHIKFVRSSVPLYMIVPGWVASRRRALI